MDDDEDWPYEGWETRDLDYQGGTGMSSVERGTTERGNYERITPEPIPYLTACIIEDFVNTLEMIGAERGGDAAWEARRALDRARKAAASYL